MILERDTTGNSVPSTSVPESTNSAFDPPPDSSRALPNALRISSLTVVQPAVSHLASSTTAVDGGDCVISLLSPCGTTSGGEQIVLVVVNLPLSVTFFARFGDNVVSTVRCECSKRSRPA